MDKEALAGASGWYATAVAEAQMKNGCVHREDMLREWSRLQGWPELLREARVRIQRPRPNIRSRVIPPRTCKRREQPALV
jgi:hypothetical protein